MVYGDVTDPLPIPRLWLNLVHNYQQVILGTRELLALRDQFGLLVDLEKSSHRCNRLGFSANI